MSEVGYYLVKLDVSTGLAGAPTLHLTLGVYAPTGHVTGSGEVTQALPPPYGVTPIPQLSGQIHHTGWGKDQQLVHLTGTAYLPHPPTQPIEIPAHFAASLAVDAAWNGTGSFTVGNHTITHAKVTKVG